MDTVSTIPTAALVMTDTPHLTAWSSLSCLSMFSIHDFSSINLVFIAITCIVSLLWLPPFAKETGMLWLWDTGSACCGLSQSPPSPVLSCAGQIEIKKERIPHLFTSRNVCPLVDSLPVSGWLYCTQTFEIFCFPEGSWFAKAGSGT